MRIIQHHVKYVETHGFDEIEFITDSEHHLIDHRKLFPMVTPEELKRISIAAWRRTLKGKIRSRFVGSDYLFVMNNYYLERGT